MGCAHSSPAVILSAKGTADNGKAKKKLKTPSAVQTHDRDTIKTFGRSLEDNVDTINYVSHAAVPGIEEPPLPPPETQLRWKLSLEEIEHRRTLNRLDEIKSIGLAVLQVPKCRVTLISCTHVWITTSTGAFSPALQVEGAPWQGSFDHFYLEKNTDPFMMEDARLDPRCANHPGVIGRPNIRFYLSVPLISRGHLLGLYYMADSRPRSHPSEQQMSQLVDLAAQAVDVLQEDMFNCLLSGNKDSTESKKKTKNNKKKASSIDLPAVWIDVATPQWRILGVNHAWETLTGVTYNDLKACQGFLKVMSMAIASNEGGLVQAVENARKDPSLAPVPAVLSPASPSGVSQQYIFAFTPATKNQKAPWSVPHGAVETNERNGNNIWIAEVHGRVQAAADLNGTLKIDPSAVTHRILLPSEDPSFGSLLTVQENYSISKPSSMSSPATSQSYGRHYQYNMHSYINSPFNSTPVGSKSSSGGSGSGGNPIMIAKPPTSTTPHASDRGRNSFESSHLLLISATSAIEAGTMHIPPRLATLKRGPALGIGSYGSVYWGTLGDAGVAIKVMQHAAGPEAGQQLWAAQYEAMVASDLSHENLVRTIDWCCHIQGNAQGGTVWIIQELCNKGSLAIAIKEGSLRIIQGNVESAPDMHAVLETAADVARGMAYLHSHDVIHGDLSSNNVLFISAENNKRGYQAKVTDFGLSRALGGQDCATKTVGTVSHMPPELLISGVMAKGGDVYSFGAMLWELYTGKRAWSGCSQAQVIFAITCRQERLELPSDAPAGYAALTSICMDPERLNRPTFDAILKKLEGLLAAQSCQQ
ncbi:hypothetical protein Ndes2437B_g06678 [Nannochloris sp. 'desiccata']